MTGRVVVHVDVASSEADVVSGVIWAHGATAVQELVGDGDIVRLIAGIPAEAVDRLRAELGGGRSLTVEDAEHNGWLDAWRPFARPVRAGPFVIHPSWEVPPEAAPGEILVPIDAGSVFGQGSHISTQLALARLGDVDLAGASVLDVGTGSGVLAVGAARLGASLVTAIDIDPECIAVACRNADRNGVTELIDPSVTPVVEVTGTYDVVIANILAPVLIDLAPAIARRVTCGGTILLSGLLTEQRDRVRSAYGSFPLDSEHTEDGWVVLTLGAVSRSR